MTHACIKRGLPGGFCSIEGMVEWRVWMDGVVVDASTGLSTGRLLTNTRG
jgi:hypothetical protein